MHRKYTVKAGDTLQSIAASECGSVRLVDVLIRDNHLTDASAITPGMELLITCDDERTEIAPRPPKIDEDTAVDH